MHLNWMTTHEKKRPSEIIWFYVYVCDSVVSLYVWRFFSSLFFSFIRSICRSVYLTFYLQFLLFSSWKKLNVLWEKKTQTRYTHTHTFTQSKNSFKCVQMIWNWMDSACIFGCDAPIYFCCIFCCRFFVQISWFVCRVFFVNCFDSNQHQSFASLHFCILVNWRFHFAREFSLFFLLLFIRHIISLMSSFKSFLPAFFLLC